MVRPTSLHRVAVRTANSFFRRMIVLSWCQEPCSNLHSHIRINRRKVMACWHNHLLGNLPSDAGGRALPVIITAIVNADEGSSSLLPDLLDHTTIGRA